MGKRTLNDFFKCGDFFTHHSFDRSFYSTVVYCLLIYAHLTICAENVLLLHPLIARFSTETAAIVSFWLLRRLCVCFWMHSDVHFCFSLLSFSLSSASPSFFVGRRGLSFAPFCFSRRHLDIQSFTSPSCHRCRLLSRFDVQSSASHSFISACHHHHRPATRLLQLLIAAANVDSLSS